MDRGLFARMVEALAHRGIDGSRTVRRWGSALAHLGFRTTPEEAGERQPVSRLREGFDLAFDGRLDNRGELARRLGLERDGGTDAEIAAAAYERWGEDCFRELLGPFAVVVVDHRRRRVVCGRDPLGDRALFYLRREGLLAVASEEQALLVHPGASRELDDGALARFFAVEEPDPGATFFADVRELPPGCALVVDGERTRRWRHWEPDPERRLRLASEAEYAEAFRELLAEAVRCRLRSPSPPAVLMSGGLDSTSLASLAAREAEGPVLAVSWVFDELPGADERRFMDPVLRRWGLRAVRIPGDGEWPLRDAATLPVNPNTPQAAVYRRLQDRAYAAAREAGCRTLLTGEFGDHLFTGGEYWLRSLGREAGCGAVLAALGSQLWAHGLRRRPTAAPSGTVLARALGLGRPAWLAPRRGAAWLEPRALAHLPPPPAPGPWRRPTQARSLLGLRPARGRAAERYHASRAGIEVRAPFRDRRLVEFALAIPGHLLRRPGWSKWLLRQAMAGVLPEEVRRRRERTTLWPLAVRGLVERERETVAALLHRPDALWRGIVREAWLRSALRGMAAGRDGVEAVVPWQCIAAELWRRAVAAPAAVGLDCREVASG